jgi:Zn-dependent peptidase ImmA (M78 family)
MDSALVKFIREFLAWVKPKLGLEHEIIKIKLLHDDICNGKQRTFAYFDPDTNQIVVSVKNRHEMDIARSLAHELVHLAQSKIRPLTADDGITGSPVECEANSVAGIIMRLWGTRDR